MLFKVEVIIIAPVPALDQLRVFPNNSSHPLVISSDQSEPRLHMIKYRGIRQQFVPGVHSDTPMGLREVACVTAGPRGSYPVSAESYASQFDRPTCGPQPPVPQTKAVSPRRGSSKEEKAVSAFLSETLALTAPTATPEDWQRVQAAKSKVTRKSPRKKVLKPGHFTGQCWVIDRVSE